MEYSRDEVRRQLVASRGDHTAAMAPWREALLRIFGTENQIPASAKAQLLGVPSRRGFLKVGGATVLGAAVLAACGYDTGDVSESGAASNLTTTTADPAAGEFDLALLRTATSLEILAVNTYQAAIESGLIDDVDVLAAATLFRDQHDDHRAALEEATVAVGGPGSEFTEANSFVQENVIDPALAELTDEASVVELALTIESAAAETYAWAAGELSTTTLRQAIMGIGGVEARHMAVMRGFLDQDQVPVAFLPTEDRLPEEALIAADAAAAGAGTDTTTTTGPETTTSVVGATTTTAG